MRWKLSSSQALGFVALAGLLSVALPPAALAVDEEVCLAKRGAMIAAAYPDAGPEEYRLVQLEDPARSILLDDVACARVPGVDGLTAILVPIRHKDSDAWLEVVGDLEVLVFEDGSDAPRFRILEQRLASEDAFRFSGHEIDTRHHRAGPTPIFGVRITRANGSRYNPATVSSLRLYRIAEGKLEAILTDLAVHENYAEWNGTCEGAVVETWRNLLVGDHGHNSLADLVVVGRTLQSFSSGSKEPCMETTEHMREEPAVLVFDGRRYPVPEALRGIDADYQH